MLKELRKKYDVQASGEPVTKPISLLERAIRSIVADFLQREGFTNSLSVFIPESYMSDGPLSRQEILSSLRIHADLGDSQDSVLHGLMQFLSAKCNVQTESISIQTDRVITDSLGSS